MQMEGKPERERISQDVFDRVKLKAEAFYSALEPVNCPYLQCKVHFNIKGLDHIKFKEWNKPRVLFDQFQRLKIITVIPQILNASHTVQGKWNRKEWERQKKHGRWEKKTREVVYYEFVAVIENVRAKVIVKEITGNPPFFWTIIPFWRMNEVTNARILHDADILKDGNFKDDVE